LTSERAGWQFALAVVLVGQWVIVPAAYAVDPAHFKAGPVYVAPTFSGELRYIDNLLRSPEPTIQTWGTVLKPKLQTWLQDGFNTYSLSYELLDYTYFDSSEDDATDHKLDLDIHQEINARNKLKLYAKYYELHEERGTGLSEGAIAQELDEPVEFDYLRFGGEYSLGNERSDGLLELEARFEEIEYQNFRDVTAFRDRDTTELRGTFYYRAGARTKALMELRRIEQNYKTDYIDPDFGVSKLDSTEYIGVVGMSWMATAKTSGKIKLGGFRRDYRDSAHDDDSGFHWEADLIWNPRTYSTLHLGTRRLSRETNGEGDYVDTAEFQADWKHLWSHRTSSRISFKYADEEYVGSSRDDDIYRAGASLGSSVRRWVDLEVGYRYEKRSSSAQSLSFDRNVFFLGVRMSL
jgi:hypothetical protein